MLSLGQPERHVKVHHFLHIPKAQAGTQVVARTTEGGNLTVCASIHVF